MTDATLIDERTTEAETAQAVFDAVARLSPDSEGVSRPAFSAIETATLSHLEALAREWGLAAWYDPGRNLVVSLHQDRDAPRARWVGSHVDSVPQGGNFDGLAGVMAGLMCLRRARLAGVGFARPVHVIAMRGEESAWFGPCYIGSKALLGRLEKGELDARHKGDGRKLADHMADCGLPMDRIADGRPLIDPGAIDSFVEVHIEQGPLLIGKDIPVAVVGAIRGNIRYRSIQCLGAAGHSGAVPKAFRRDPVLAMCDLLVRLDESWTTILNKGGDLVLTSGMVGTDPASHAMTRIADAVSFSLDIRSQSAETLDAVRTLLQTEAQAVARDRGVRFDFGEEMRVAPAVCDPDVMAALRDAMAAAGQTPFVMPSGGGHDTSVFAAAGIPAAMVFVRNRNGSHTPDEAMEVDDFLAATDIVYQHLMAARA